MKEATIEQAARLRLPRFTEEISNALISQSAPLLAGSPTLFSFVQNIARTHARGAELVGEESGFGPRDLDLSGWIICIQSDIVADDAFANAVSKQLPQLPRLRGGAVQTYRSFPKLAFTVAERYSDRSFGTIDNSDHFANTFTDFGAYSVMDLHVQYVLTPHITGDVGVDNLNDRKYFLYHPSPQRTVAAQLNSNSEA